MESTVLTNQPEKSGAEQPFSQEGLLNRNFGKDVEKPTSGLFYRDGILNREKFHEDFGRVYNKVMNGGTAAEVAQEASVGNPQPENTVRESPVESQPVSPAAESSSSELEPVDQAMKDLFDVFKNEADPEAAAFEYIKTHLDPSLPWEEQLDKLKKFRQDYQKYKEQILNSLNN